MSDTKESILLAALRLFARDGFEATSVSTIAGALGITKGALYRHYRNKRDIFDSIVARMEQQDAESAAAFSLPEGTLQEMPDEYRHASVNSLVDFSRAQFRYWTEDDFASSFRKMRTLEQYRSEEMMHLYQQYLAAGPLGYTADLFRSLGYEQPEKKAAAFYAPMFLLYSVYDGAQSKSAVTAEIDEYLESVRRRMLLEKHE